VTKTSEPIFNAPGIVLAIIAVCALVWAGEDWLLTDEETVSFVYCLGFVPARYGGEPLPAWLCPSGTGAEIWSFVTYAFLHGSFMHLATNSFLFLLVGTPVARRFGPLRVLGFFAATAAGGALMTLVMHWDEQIPMVGASAAFYGFAAGAIRFVFQPGGPVARFRDDDPTAYFVPAAPLSSALRNYRSVLLVAAWLGLNVLEAIVENGADSTLRVSWEAHVGGFLAGLLLFPLFDPVPAQAA
jgi:membrane associated rhomboid family serine protease